MFNDLALIASAYEFQHLYVAVPQNVITRILPADSRRWSVVFIQNQSPAATVFLSPGSNKSSMATQTGWAQSTPIDFTFKDHPGFVGQEWYAFQTGFISVQMEIWISRFVGG